MKIALFGDEAQNPPNANDIVRISQCYAYRPKKSLGTESAQSLGTKTSTSMEVIILVIML